MKVKFTFHAIWVTGERGPYVEINYIDSLGQQVYAVGLHLYRAITKKL